MHADPIPGFGADFKSAVRKRYPALVALHPYGEVLPYSDNRITVGDSGVDDYGVPIAKITFKYRENERKMAKEMYETAASIMHAAKAEILPYDKNYFRTSKQLSASLVELDRAWTASQTELRWSAPRAARLFGVLQGPGPETWSDGHATEQGTVTLCDGRPWSRGWR